MKNPIKSLFSLSRSRVSRGYTVIELLVAASLTGLVLSGSGFAWLNVVNANQKSKAASTLMYNVNRAAEFIQDEIKQANSIAPDAALAVTEITDFTLPTDATPVLVLNTAEGHKVVYYTQPATNPWVGPNVITRWGYPLDENGQ